MEYVRYRWWQEGCAQGYVLEKLVDSLFDGLVSGPLGDDELWKRDQNKGRRVNKHSRRCNVWKIRETHALHDSHKIHRVSLREGPHWVHLVHVQRDIPRAQFLHEEMIEEIIVSGQV